MATVPQSNACAPASGTGVNAESAAAFASRLVDRMAELGSCAVAFSGGVDSAVVAAAAHRALGAHALAVTGVGPSVAAGELDEAARVAAQIGVEHQTVETDESNDPRYIANAPDRCYHCKTSLYEHVRRVADRRGLEWIANGANADDLVDHRPGARAAAEHRVVSPLAECGMGKELVRAVARMWGLPIWDKPAAPCLASRVAYGVPATPERLARIDAAEAFLRECGLREVRVRVHEGELARIEAPLEWVARLAESPLRERLAARFRELGFGATTLDLDGFRSGRMNEFVPVESLERARRGPQG